MSASDSVLMSILAARESALKKLQEKYPNQEKTELLSKLVGYASEVVRNAILPDIYNYDWYSSHFKLLVDLC